MKAYTQPIPNLETLSQSASTSTHQINGKGRLVLKGGRLIDPKNGIDAMRDLAVRDGSIVEVAENITGNAQDTLLNCQDLVVMPGLIDIHVHLGDLFDVYESPLFKAAKDGVTLGLSPGAGNTFMAPALLGAEVDRGVPLNAGVYLGGAAVLGSSLDTHELTALFTKTLEPDVMSQRLTRNAITNSTAHLVVGIKDHMGHFIMPDEKIDLLFEVTAQSNLIYMSHTQDPEHAKRMTFLSRGRPLHLAHATAAGCGIHGDPVKGFKAVMDLVDGENITAEFVSSMLCKNRGRRDGMKIHLDAQALAYRALQDRKVKIIISDGQSSATMKGFGNTADNLPCLFTLAEQEVLSLSDAVATMTQHPAAFLSQRLGAPFFAEKCGHLAPGAYANITVADPLSQRAIYTIVNSALAAFEGSLVREGFGAGCLVSKYGFSPQSGVGLLPLY